MRECKQPITKLELFQIKNEIDEKINRIKFLDDNNFFENKEIILLKREVRELIDFLRQASKVNRIALSSFRLL